MTGRADAHDAEPWTPAGTPHGDIEVPDAVAAVIGDADQSDTDGDGTAARCVWRNGRGGLTFEIGGGARYLKWAPAGSGLPLLAEAERMRWARPYSPVPEVLDAATAEDGSTWLLTAALPGTTAVADRWVASPRTAVRAVGEGLRAFHDAAPVTTCPFDWSTPARVARARERAATGLIEPSAWHPDHRGLTLDEALAVVADPPPVDRLVVCHGDACAPNTLVGDDGRWTGHVDLGAMGVGDRWADLAVATWSTRWNYGPGWEDELLDAYGVDADPERTRYHRLLWDLGD